MFCHNCGNKLEEKTIVCTNCGTVVERSNYKKRKKSNNVKGFMCLILGILSILMCFNFLLKDISKLGMYTEINEKLYYAIDLVLAPLLLSFITLIISYSDKNRVLNKIGLFLSISSLFMVCLEIVLVIIY